VQKVFSLNYFEQKPFFVQILYRSKFFCIISNPCVERGRKNIARKLFIKVENKTLLWLSHLGHDIPKCESRMRAKLKGVNFGALFMRANGHEILEQK
jgi:hypothetical protein